ncbi:MAG: hypothetical protein ABIS84_07595 [Arachnia sp.]
MSHVARAEIVAHVLTVSGTPDARVGVPDAVILPAPVQRETSA